MNRPLVICVIVLTIAAAVAQERGIKGQDAPAWDIATWINLPDGEDTLDSADFRGKVLYLFTFQSW